MLHRCTGDETASVEGKNHAIICVHSFRVDQVVIVAAAKNIALASGKATQRLPAEY